MRDFESRVINAIRKLPKSRLYSFLNSKLTKELFTTRKSEFLFLRKHVTKYGTLPSGAVYAALALGILFLLCFAIYFFGYRDHPVLIVPENSGPTPTMVYPDGAPKPAPAKPAPAPVTPPKK